MNIGRNPIYKTLDRGDGICLHFDEKSKLCKIYESRPLLCRVDETYDRIYRDLITRDKFYEWNYHACRQLKENAKEDH